MATDSMKVKWPTVRGREDMTFELFFYEDADENTPYDLTVFDGFATAAHHEDGTSSASPPLAEGLAYIDTVGGTITNKLIVVYSGALTGTLQESGYVRGRLDVFATGDQRTKLAEGVWVMDKSVSITF